MSVVTSVSAHKPRSALLAWAVISACLLSANASAYDWKNRYGANLTLGYNDNFRLSESNEIETSSSNLGVFTDITGNTEISSLQLAIRANGDSYSESEIENSTSYNVLLATSRRGERLTGSLNISADSASTTETELLDTGVTVDGTRDTLSVSPRLSYQFNERNNASVSLNARDVSYDTVSLTEYTDNSLQLTWSHRLDEASDISLSLRTSEYDPEEGDRIDTDSINAAYAWRTSEAMTYELSVGYTDVDRPGNPEAGSVYGFDARYQRDERNTFGLNVTNSYQPSGEGDVREQDQLGLQWNHGLSERSQLNLVVDAISTEDRDFISFLFGGNHQYSREVNLAANIRYRQQDSNSNDADSLSLLVSLSYTAL